MNFDINDYCERLKAELLLTFGQRLLYMGLQGSYLRGEATERSDIDMMVILDGLTVDDMDLYREILHKVGEGDCACGFICGAEDMKNWNPLEICQLGFTTKDLYGTLADFLPGWTREDEVNYVKAPPYNSRLAPWQHICLHLFHHSSQTSSADGHEVSSQELAPLASAEEPLLLPHFV